MTTGVKLLRKQNKLLKGYFQTTIVLTVENTCLDYWPALLNGMPTGGLFYREYVRKSTNHVTINWVIKIQI